MDFLAISPEIDTENEALVIAQLIDAGLYRYHVRKPAQSAAEVARLLERVPRAYRQRIVVHQHPEHVRDFELGGYHCKDRPGVTAERDSWQARWHARDAPSPTRPTLTRSLHALDGLAAACAGWDYVLISPIFASISKTGYRPNWTSDALCAALLAASAPGAGAGVGKRYALGGVCFANVAQCIAMGFDGVVLHGALWHAPDPVAELKNCRRQVDAWITTTANQKG